MITFTWEQVLAWDTYVYDIVFDDRDSEEIDALETAMFMSVRPLLTLVGIVRIG